MARFSLITATVDRTGELSSFLASLDAQTHRDFKLIVVDQNSDDRLSPVLAPFSSKFEIARIRTDVRGLSRARNLGLKHASGDVIAFPDDDCEYPPGLLGEVDGFLMANPEMDGLTGRLIDHSGKTSNGRFDVMSGKVNATNAWIRAIECTVFLRRESAKGMWFDEELGVGSGTIWGASEGTDYLIRLVNRGAVIHYDPDLKVVHPPFPTKFDEESIRKAYAYGCGKGRVLRKNDAPLWLKAYYLFRPIVAVAYYGIKARFPVARWYWNVFKGRLYGLTQKGPSAIGKTRRER
jgi:glycosyltransferase involved in cell wall biosynthesis